MFFNNFVYDFKKYSWILEEVDVIGIIIIGLVKNIVMLCGIGVKVVICEEVVEVMEFYFIFVMMFGIEYFI